GARRRLAANLASVLRSPRSRGRRMPSRRPPGRVPENGSRGCVRAASSDKALGRPPRLIARGQGCRGSVSRCRSWRRSAGVAGKWGGGEGEGVRCGDAEAGGERPRWPGRGLDALGGPFADPPRCVGWRGGEHDDELLTAVSRNQLVLAHAVAERLRQVDQG